MFPIGCFASVPPMMETKHFKIKICLVGEQGVGKTSLIHRFVSGAFDESYIRTLGVVVSKKTVTLEAPPRSVRADLMVSDIMGKRAFLDLFKDAYFHGTQGVLAVFDVTRRDTLIALRTWIESIRETVGRVPVCALGNKIDLGDLRETTEGDAAAALRSYGCPILYTSAKTGENVEDAFHGLARAILGHGAPP